MKQDEANLPGQPPDRLMHDAVAQRIEERLRCHVQGSALAAVRDAVVRGQVVRLETPDAPSIVAFKRGVLFVAGMEYVISDDE